MQYYLAGYIKFLSPDFHEDCNHKFENYEKIHGKWSGNCFKIKMWNLVQNKATIKMMISNPGASSAC